MITSLSIINQVPQTASEVELFLHYHGVVKEDTMERQNFLGGVRTISMTNMTKNFSTMMSVYFY